MTNRAEASPGLLARITGVLLLVMAVGAGFAEGWVRGQLVAPGDAAATAANILASGRLYRLGLVGYLVAFLCDVPVAVLLYVLLRSVSRPLALVAAAFRLVYAAFVGANLVLYLGAHAFLSGAGYLGAFETPQLQALALLCLDMHEQGFHLALVFFGVHLLLLAVLLLRSTSFPKVLGVLIALAGASYLIGNVSLFLAPEVNAVLAPFLALPASFELVLALWLTVKGLKQSDRAAGAGLGG